MCTSIQSKVAKVAIKSQSLPDSAPGISVHGAGLEVANGIYVRTGFKVGNSDAFQKRGTSLALLKRGEGLDWSLVDLDGQLQQSTEEDNPAKGANSISSAFAPGKLRWNPYSVTLYKVASTLNSGTCLLPPQLGWVVVDGLAPAPSMSPCQEESTRPEKILAAAMPGKLLKRIAASSPMHGGSIDFELLATRFPACAGTFGFVLLVFSVILSRPSVHAEWGAVFDKQQLVSTGRRIVSGIEPHTPFDRWNTWQMVRGRQDMCIRRGVMLSERQTDQLLKQNGGWAFSEVPLESPEGFEDLAGMEDDRVEGVCDTMLVMEFGRKSEEIRSEREKERRCRMEPWEVGYGLRVEIDSFLAGPYEEDVLAWALILKEEIADANLGSESLGVVLSKAESCWRAYNSESGKGVEEKPAQEVPPREVVVSGAVLCCPTAASFFDGLKEGWDVYETMLDFEDLLSAARLERIVSFARYTTSITSIAVFFFDSSQISDFPGSESFVEVNLGDELCPVGLNSAGLGICVFNLHDRQTDGFQQPSLSTVVWELLLCGHTMSSALTWLRGLALQPMCGSALLLVDDSGAVTVELNPGGLVIGEVRQAEAVSRSNHPILPESNATFGGNRRARLDSQRRLEAHAANGCPPAVLRAGNGRNGLPSTVTGSPKSAGTAGYGGKRNTFAIQMFSLFRERQEVSASEAARFAVNPIIHDVEVAAIMADGGPISLLLAEGVKTGRTYTACIAMLTDVGWSVHVKQRPGLMDGILSLVLPPEDEQMLMMSALSNLKKSEPKRAFAALRFIEPALVPCNLYLLESFTWSQSGAQESSCAFLCEGSVPFFILPSHLQPGFSAPVATKSTTTDPCELLSKRRLLKMPLVLPNGRPKGLHVAEEGGSTLLVVEEGSWQGKENSPMLNLSNMSVPWRLCSGDFIVRINGLAGAEKMLQELNRNPPVLAIEILRGCGGKKESETAQVFDLDRELDDHCQRLVSEIRTHGLLSSDAELASLLVGGRDDLIQNALDKAQKFKNDVVPKRPSDGAPVPEAEDMDNAIKMEAQRRLLVLRRFHMMESCAKESEKGQLSEACRLLQVAMADASFSAAKLGQKIEEFKQFGGSAVRASAPAQILLKRAIFQRELWHWRERLRSERRDLKEAVEEMVRMEMMDQEHTKRFPGRPMNQDDVEKIVQARNVLDRQVRQGRSFRRQLIFDMAEAEAVLNRNLHSAAGQRKLSPEEEYARFNPERTLSVGKKKGWYSSVRTHYLNFGELLFADEEGKDVKFQTKDGAAMAHSSVLRAVSKPFRQMLSGEMSEGRTKTIELPDSTRADLLFFLRLLYTGQVDEADWDGLTGTPNFHVQAPNDAEPASASLLDGVYLAQPQGGLDLGALLGGLGGLDAGPPAKKGKGGTMTNMSFFPSSSDQHKKMMANGCGPEGLVVKEPYGLWRCCNSHDVCFSVCGTSHNFCEEIASAHASILKLYNIFLHPLTFHFCIREL
eukprot:s2180_g2.t4